MDWGVFWAAIGACAGVIALVGVVFAIATYFRQSPRRSVEYALDVSRLIPNDPSRGEVEVRVRGVLVDNPHVGEFFIRSRGRNDIPSTSFDGGHPIVIRIEDGGALELSRETDGIEIDGGRGEGFDWAEYQIQPQLIRRRSRTSITFMCSGVPRVVVSSSLIDIAVNRLARVDDSKGWANLKWVLLGAAVSVSAVTLASVITSLLRF